MIERAGPGPTREGAEVSHCRRTGRHPVLGRPLDYSSILINRSKVGQTFPFRPNNLWLSAPALLVPVVCQTRGLWLDRSPSSSAAIRLYPSPLFVEKEKENRRGSDHILLQEEDGEVIILINGLIAALLELE